MSNLQLWSLIVAFFVPPITAALVQSRFTPHLKAAIFFGVSLIAAAGTAYFQGDLTGKRWLEAALVIVAGGAAYYHGLWKPSGVAPAIEEATDISDGK